MQAGTAATLPDGSVQEGTLADGTWRNIAGCPTLQYGPGELSQCHSVDEHIELEMYYDAILTYAALILEWCGK